MARPVKIVVKGTDHLGDDAPTVEDLLSQIKDQVEIFKEVETAIVGDNTPSLVWRVTNVTRNSPISFEITPYPKIYGTSIDDHAKKVIQATANGMKEIQNKGTRPDYFTDIVLKKMDGFSRRLSKGLSETKIDFSEYGDIPDFTLRVDSAHQTVKKIAEIQKPAARPYRELGSIEGEGKVIDTLVADLSSIKDTNAMAQDVLKKYDNIDVLINNAGVFTLPPDQVTTIDGLDKRFAVNTIAPYLLTKTLLPIIPKHGKGRVVNLSSAAEAPVDFDAVAGRHTHPLSDGNAYSQSKLAVTMFTYALSQQHTDKLLVSLNPASMLGTKMVKEGYGVAGHDISIGSTIIAQMATSKKYSDIKHVSGRYYDNDSQRFANPRYYKDYGFNLPKCQELINVMDTIIEEKLN